MKRLQLFRLVMCGITFLFATSCQKKSGDMWEENQTGAKYSRKNASSLWGNNNALAENDGFTGPSEDSFVPLSDEDLKTQFAENITPQPALELGEEGMPTADEFHTPKGALASVLSPVFFNTDDHVLRDRQHLETIDKIAAYLKSHPDASLIIEGHTDERAGEAYNLALGTRRANYVRSLLIKKGVSPNQLHSISYGKERPFVTGHGPDVWAQNRRAHFRVHQK